MTTANKLRQKLAEAQADLELIDHNISRLEMKQNAKMDQIMDLQSKLEAAEYLAESNSYTGD